MMADAEMAFMTIAHASVLLRDGHLSPVELTQSCLDQIRRSDSELHAFTTVLGEQALDQARHAEMEIRAGRYRGALHGIPYSAKDLIDTDFAPTTGASRLFSEYMPTRSAAVIERLTAAGAILIGKTNLNEFAMGGTRNHPYGTPVNPWSPDLSPGGSSHGSAIAVASGMPTFSLGTDTGGSVRIPARACGVYGLKPTFGLVSRRGVWPLLWWMDSVGVIARSAEDCSIVLSAMVGPDSDDPTTALAPSQVYWNNRGEVRGMRVGVIKEFTDLEGQHENAEAVRGFLDFLRTAGAHTEVASLPAALHGGALFLALRDVDNALLHADLNRILEMIDENSRANLVTAALLPAHWMSKIRRLLTGVRAEILALANQWDALVWSGAIGSGQRPPTPGNLNTAEDVIRNYSGRNSTVLANIAGIPAMAIPLGLSSTGVPMGLQVGAAQFREDSVFAIAGAWEQRVGMIPHPPRVSL